MNPIHYYPRERQAHFIETVEDIDIIRDGKWLDLVYHGTDFGVMSAITTDKTFKSDMQIMRAFASGFSRGLHIDPSFYKQY